MTNQDRTYYYEFGIIAADMRATQDEDDEFNIELNVEPTTAVVDLREIATFDCMKEVDGPYGKTFRNIVAVEIKNGCQLGLYYPYPLFKKLFASVMDMPIVRMPYLDEDK